MKMKHFMVILIVLAATAAISTPSRADLTRDQRISDARALIALFEHRYAPAQWKSEYMGIELGDVVARLLGEAYRQDSNDLDFYAAMARVSGSLKDTHSWFIIPSLYSAYLGFSCDYVEGRYVISYVNRSLLPESQFPFYRGDEILSIDGVPTQEIIEELSQYDGEANDLTEKRFLAGNLTYRPQRTYAHVPTGPATVEIYSQDRGEAGTAAVKWITYGKPLAETKDADSYETPAGAMPSSSDEEMIGSSIKDARTDLEHLRWSAISATIAQEAMIGGMQPFYPLWDSFEIRNEYPLLTGTFKVDGHRIGFIRIPTWNPPSSTPWFELLDDEIPYFEKKTDALVIDETDNGGGSICLANEVSRYLIDSQIKKLLFQIRANRARSVMYDEGAEWCDAQKEKPEWCGTVKAIAEELRKALAEGRALTRPLDTCRGDGFIRPMMTKGGRKLVYTKPVMILVNEFSISAADMFPAPLQDSGRAVIFGERTCGAGGSVTTLENIGYSDFQISQTQSLAVRAKEITSVTGVKTPYLENVGVIPDVQYSITYDDFMDGYKGYKAAVEDAIRGLVK